MGAKLKVLITDNRSDLALIVGRFLTDSGHSVVTTDLASHDSLTERHFDLVIENLDQSVEEIKSLGEIPEKTERAITLFIAEWLKDIRTKRKFSSIQLGNWLTGLKKTRNFELAILNKRTASKIVRLFETGEFCPSYEYLEAVANACSREDDLECILNSIEIEFGPQKEKSEREIIIALLNIYYKKELSNIEKIINPNTFDNLLNFPQYKNLKSQKGN